MSAFRSSTKKGEVVLAHNLYQNFRDRARSRRDGASATAVISVDLDAPIISAYLAANLISELGNMLRRAHEQHAQTHRTCHRHNCNPIQDQVQRAIKHGLRGAMLPVAGGGRRWSRWQFELASKIKAEPCENAIMTLRSHSIEFALMIARDARGEAVALRGAQLGHDAPVVLDSLIGAPTPPSLLTVCLSSSDATSELCGMV